MDSLESALQSFEAKIIPYIEKGKIFDLGLLSTIACTPFHLKGKSKNFVVRKYLKAVANLSLKSIKNNDFFYHSDSPWKTKAKKLSTYNIHLLKQFLISNLRLIDYIYCLGSSDQEATLEDLKLVSVFTSYLAKHEQQESINNYLLYPRIVHLETQTICNAKCSFCPYVSLDRKGHIMESSVINNVIEQLSDQIPTSHHYSIQPYKINEPFLDTRLPAILAKILSNTHAQVNIISNLNYLPESSYSELKMLSTHFPNRINLTVSLNNVNPAQYQQLMKLNFKKTIENLYQVDADISSGVLALKSFKVSAVPSSLRAAQAFYDYTSDRFLNCTHLFAYQNDWLGKIERNNSDFETNLLIEDLPCNRWGDLSIMSNGKLALCCMDSEGIIQIGNISQDKLLNLYREKNKLFLNIENKNSVEFLSSRRYSSPASPCSNCNYYQPSISCAKSIMKTVNFLDTNNP